MKKIMFILICVLLVGCGGKHCIKVGGSYDGAAGDLEYCFEETASKEAGITVLSGDAGNAVLLTEQQAAKLLEKVDTEKKTILNVGTMKRLAELLKK